LLTVTPADFRAAFEAALQMERTKLTF
jgi:hypothetical protein